MEDKAMLKKTDRKIKKCWEVLQCNEKECPVYIQKEDLRCWLISGTHCRNEIQGKFLEKMEMCLRCEVFRTNMDVSSMRKTMKVVSQQFIEYRRAIEERDDELQNVGMEMALGLSEVFEALKKISSGDPEVRVSEKSKVELISKLKHIINLTAEEIGEIVDQSHEVAIGIAEHFDVLHKVSRGDLEARVSGSSKVELLESLKNVTNKMIESISNVMVERMKTEDVLKQRTHDLWARVKELNCLYSISELLEERDLSLEGMIQGIVDRIPYAWQFPEITCVRATVGGEQFSTKNFTETDWRLESPLYAHGKKVGAVEVYYLESKPLIDEGPFSKEERNLLNVIAQHTGRMIERLRAEEVLRNSEEQYRTVFENTGSATIIVEQDTTISLVNTEFEKLSGYRKEEIEGRKSWEEFFDTDDLQKMRECHYARRIDPESAPVNCEVRFIDRNGNMKNILMSVSVIPGTKKSVETLIDITERKKLEERMYHTEKLASIGTLAGGVAHEINNPLAIILGFSDLMLEKVSKDSEFYDLLTTIHKHGTNAKRIVENLLSFVRYKEQREENVDIHKSLTEVLTVKGNTLTVNNIQVKTDLEESLLLVKGDPGELQQAFFNIVNNAISAMNGGGELMIRTRALETDEGRIAEIRISDTGTGIRPEHRSRIFDPLFTTKKVGEGTGLGLTVSYAIIKKYGGELAFETKTPDESETPGTTFIMSLPAISAGGQ